MVPELALYEHPDGTEFLIIITDLRTRDRYDKAYKLLGSIHLSLDMDLEYWPTNVLFSQDMNS